MADYGSYDSGTGDVISAIQRPAIDLTQQQPQQQQGFFVPQGGGPVIPSTPENISQFGPPIYAAGPQPSNYNQHQDLIDQAIQARQSIDARRQELYGHLNALPQGRHGASQSVGILAELHGLDAQDRNIQDQTNALDIQRRFEATQGRLMAHQSAEDAAQALKIDREHSIDQQGAQLMTGLGQLDSAHRNGLVDDNQYNQSLLDLGQQYGLGLRHPDAGKMYDHFVTEADRRTQFNLRRTGAEAARVAARYGVDVQTDDNGMPSIELTRQAALGTDKGKAEALKQMNSEMAQKYGVNTGVASLFNPIVPHSSDDEWKTINVPYVDKTGKTAAIKVSAPLFNQMKSDFNDRYQAVAPQNVSKKVQEGYTSINLGPSGSMEVSGNDNLAPKDHPVSIGGLQQGAQRTVGGVNYSWNGSRWEQQ